MSENARWLNEELGPYVRVMPTCRKFHLLRPERSGFRLEEVVHHTVRIRRFNGTGIPVAQHMVVGAIMAERFYPGAALLPQRFLVHDAHEAYYGDVASPTKRCLPDYCALEALGTAEAERWADLTFVDNELVKEVDTRMWLTERLITQPQLRREDDYAGPLEEFPLDREELEGLFTPWYVFEAEEEYRLSLDAWFPGHTFK